MRIVFMGTPDFAVPSLERLIQAGHTVCGVFCQPDKPVGRHQNKLQAPPVKQAALEHGIPVFQPTKLRDGTALTQLKELDPELIVVAAYGRILPDDILNLPPMGCINVHSSLLPNYRGAAPIHWAVLNGERETGVTIMHMAHDLDAGDIIAQAATPIDPDETVVALHDRLAVLGAELLVNVVADIAAGTATRTPQEHGKATLAPMLDKELAEFRLTDTAAHIHNWVRGMNPWPMAWFVTAGGKKVKVTECRVAASNGEAPGTVLSTKPLTVACADGAVQLLHVVPEGKKPMDGTSFAAGLRLKTGDVL